MIKIGMMLGDRYEILEKIGTGGMSDVYKARCHKLNRYVAVKVLKQEFSENTNFVSKFRVEAQAAASLMHPNIVNVYDVGEEAGIHYIVMELVEGITLKKYIEKKARLSVKEAVSIAIQACMGIGAAHNNHIIHRDIKPQNIIISKEGKVKVTDFGIAKAATSNTITSNVMGSVHYTSPEQARGGYSDEKSDIYSMGITLFEMLTGRVPFNGDTTVAIAIKHIQEPIPSPRDFVPEIPVSVEKIVLKCTQKSPDRRYQNVSSLIEDLKKSLITPDEDFVRVVDMDTDGATRMISKDDLAEIKKQTKKTSHTEEIHLKKNAVKNSSSKNTAKTKRKNAYTPDAYDDEEEEYESRMEKLTTLLAVVGAVLIGCIVIFLVGRAVGIFEFGSDEGGKSGIHAEADDPENSNGGSNAEGVEVPDVTGKSLAEAVSILESEGFVPQKNEGYSNTIAKGNIISQSPEGGSKAELGTAVTITVSQGTNQNKVEVPDVRGMLPEDAKSTLEALGLTLRNIDEVYNSDETLIGKVCGQSYSVGTPVEPGTAVDISVSKGQEATYMYMANIESPALEDPAYVEGTQCVIVLTTASGEELYRMATASFPTPVNLLSIKEATGVLTLIYNVTSEAVTTTDPATGDLVTIPGAVEQKIIYRPVEFIKKD